MACLDKEVQEQLAATAMPEYRASAVCPTKARYPSAQLIRLDFTRLGFMNSRHSRSPPQQQESTAPAGAGDRQPEREDSVDSSWGEGAASAYTVFAERERHRRVLRSADDRPSSR